MERSSYSVPPSSHQPRYLKLALRRLPLVFTAHDLLPHNRAGESFLHSNYQYTLNRAKVVFAHSSAAAAALSLARYDLSAAIRLFRHCQSLKLITLSGPAAPAKYQGAYKILGFVGAELLARWSRRVAPPASLGKWTT